MESLKVQVSSGTIFCYVLTASEIINEHLTPVNVYMF